MIRLINLSRAVQTLRQLFTEKTPLRREFWQGRLNPMAFRRFTSADTESCLELYRLNEPGRFPKGVYDHYRQLLAQKRAYVTVLEDGGRIVVTGAVAYYAGHPDAVTLCFGLVHPNHHRKGLGTALLLVRLALLKPTRAYYQVNIAAVEASIGFYRRAGFRRQSPWKDKFGQEHPSAGLILLSSEISSIRVLLHENQIEFPDDEELVPSMLISEAPDHNGSNQSASQP